MKIVKYLLSIGLVYWLVRSDQLQISSLRSHLFSSGHLWVLLLLLGNFFGQIHRWWTLLRLQEIEIPFVTMIRMGYIGQFFCITSIGSIAGEAARGFYVLKYSGTAKLAAVSTVVMDRVLGLFTYLLLGGIFTLFWLGWGEPSEVLARYGAVTLLAVGGMVLLFVLVWSPVVQRVLFDRLPVGWADVLRQIMVAYRPGRAGVWLVVGTSLLTSLTHLLAFMMASRVLGLGLGWDALFMTLPLVVLSGTLPMPLGGLGVGETAAQLLLSPLGVPNGALLMLMIRVTNWMLMLPPGAYCYLTEKDVVAR
ncbi:lysylphosphatidylglycerol synthase transmembrane domain-containing protein [Candidatus Magnetominusculus xianensis]|uniref:Flippase-like domain-containing protein n=1 Tax=Candidatus Magnetominusculus xianensis TaxID=1748249 RepID=A0ABR5SDN7_9BACT|nr:lysylphosphatidylglycerol synthase transmembrane domain-containing protein [Candidatus Magnetominusculus xianensis]KWT78812.1 hypothetical protein ASN18_2801 [Candidatus Magnetominusculus xianensis]